MMDSSEKLTKNQIDKKTLKEKHMWNMRDSEYFYNLMIHGDNEEEFKKLIKMLGGLEDYDFEFLSYMDDLYYKAKKND